MANAKFWYARHWHAYSEKCKHLTMLQHGAYTMLLDYYYSTSGKMEPEVDQLLRVCSSRGQPEDDAVLFIADKFFPIMPNGMRHNSRADDEMGIAADVSAVRRVVALKGVEARRIKALNIAIAQPIAQPIAQLQVDTVTVTVTDTVTNTLKDTPTTTTTKPKSTSPALATRLPIDWILPKSWGDWACNEYPSLAVEQIRMIADEFRDYWVGVPGVKGKKLDWAATWRNRVREKTSRGKNYINHAEKIKAEKLAGLVAWATSDEKTIEGEMYVAE